MALARRAAASAPESELCNLQAKVISIKSRVKRTAGDQGCGALLIF
jgi:hypothetical protein